MVEFGCQVVVQPLMPLESDITSLELPCILTLCTYFRSNIFKERLRLDIGIYFRGCQIGMQGPQLCAEPCHFCTLDVATSRIAFLDLNLHVVQVATSNSKN